MISAYHAAGRCIHEHHTLFLSAKEYGARLFKPKNHFASHFPSDILNHGPVRHYWAMRFEALNLLFKRFGTWIFNTHAA